MQSNTEEDFKGLTANIIIGFFSEYKHVPVFVLSLKSCYSDPAALALNDKFLFSSLNLTDHLATLPFIGSETSSACQCKVGECD